jgi:hypothetical protein
MVGEAEESQEGRENGVRMRGEKVTVERERGGFAPLPLDGPLMSIEDAGVYLRLSVAAVRQVVEAEDSELGNVLRENLVALSPRRRYIRRGPFMLWLNGKAGAVPTEQSA